MFLQEDVDAFMQLPGNSSAEAVLRQFDEQHNKYKFLEANLKQKKLRLARLTLLPFLEPHCVTRYMYVKLHGYYVS